MKVFPLFAASVVLALETVQSFAPLAHAPTLLQKSVDSSFPLNAHTSTPSLDVGVNLANLVHPSVALVTPMGVRKMKARGSGFVVDFEDPSKTDDDPYTYLVTAAHVAAPGFEIGLSFSGESQDRPATVMGRNQTLDLALLRIEKDDSLQSLEIAQDLPPTGSMAFAHGYPASRLRGPAMTCGIVCGIADGLGLPDSVSDDNPAMSTGNVFGDDSTTFVVTDAAMSGGMSGGPLTNASGAVVGVNALIRPDLRALGNYAVSAEEVESFLTRLAQDLDGNNQDKEVATDFSLLLFNDPMNKKERVSSVLEGVANMSGDDANKVMMDAHTTGKGVIRLFENRTQADDLCQALRQEDLLVEVQ